MAAAGAAFPTEGMLDATGQALIDWTSVTRMNESDVIKNFQVVQININQLIRQLNETIVPVIEKVNRTEAAQNTSFDEMISKLDDMEKKVANSVNPIISEWDKVRSQVQQYELEAGRNKDAHAIFEQNYVELQASIQGLRSHVDKTHAEANGQMGALLTTVQSQPVSGSTGQREAHPLVSNRIFDNTSKLTGNEDHHVIDDWYNDLERNFELLIPGSAAIMKWASKKTSKITFTEMSSEVNGTQVVKVSRELFAVLMNKTEDKAKSHVKILEPQDGLEAWRAVKSALNRRDGQRLQAEFDSLTTGMKPLATTDLKNLNTLLAKWEKELKDFELLDKEYKVGEFQRRQIVYRILPAEIQKMVIYQQGMGALEKYEDFLNFVKSLASSSYYQGFKAPQGIQMVNADGGPIQYTYEECIAWVATEEGAKYVEETEITDPTMVRAVYAVAKGKGKTGGFRSTNKGANNKGGDSKGAAQGGTFNGKCHKCQVWGHRIAECPEWGKQQPPNPLRNRRDKGAGKGGKGVNAVGESATGHSFCCGTQ